MTEQSFGKDLHPTVFVPESSDTESALDLRGMECVDPYDLPENAEFIGSYIDPEDTQANCGLYRVEFGQYCKVKES